MGGIWWFWSNFAILAISLGATPLSYATYGCGSTSVVRFLLDHGAKPNKTDMNGFTPLHYAASTGLLPETGCDVCSVLQ
jgi:ankyrin repeat protein